MRGDLLARQRVARTIEANPNGFTLIEIAQQEETGKHTIYRTLEVIQVVGFPLFTGKVERTNRWVFIDTFKFKIPPPFTPTELLPLYFYKDLVRVLKGTSFYESLDSVFKKVQFTEINLWEMVGEVSVHIPTVDLTCGERLYLSESRLGTPSNFTCVFNGSIWRT